MLTDRERSKLDAFRRAAKEVRDASIIARGESVEIRFQRGDAGSVDVYVKLLGNEAFRSLALAIRLVYQQGEPANFGAVANILARRASPSLSERSVIVRRAYNEILGVGAAQLAIDDGQTPSAVSAKEAFETWLYGIAFHQDIDRQPMVRRLATAGGRFHWSVQATSLQIAGRILDLDDVIADFLREERLPRLGIVSDAPPEQS